MFHNFVYKMALGVKLSPSIYGAFFYFAHTLEKKKRDNKKLCLKVKQSYESYIGWNVLCLFALV